MMLPDVTPDRDVNVAADREKHACAGVQRSQSGAPDASEGVLGERHGNHKEPDAADPHPRHCSLGKKFNCSSVSYLLSQ